MSTPPIILFVHNNDDLYGADTILLQLVKGIDRERFCPIVVLPSDVRHIGRLSAELERNGIEYRFAPLGIMRRKYFKPRKIARYFVDLAAGTAMLVRLIMERRVAAVHSNTLAVLAGALAARLTRTPHVWHVHEILIGPPWVRRLMHWMAAHLSSRVVCVSEAVRRHIAADEPAAKETLLVIRNGIDAGRFADGKGDKVRQELGVAPGQPLVGMVGKVTHGKGQALFAEAAARALARFPEARFAAVGGVFDDERHYMAEFERRIVSLELAGKFLIHDFRKDIVDVFAAFDIVVVPSTHPESFPTVALEAMAAGKPVIATARGGLCEIVAHGETGLLVGSGLPEALTAAIEELLDDPQRAAAMGAEGRRRVHKFYTAERFVREFESLYAGLTGSPRDCFAITSFPNEILPTR